MGFQTSCAHILVASQAKDARRLAGMNLGMSSSPANVSRDMLLYHNATVSRCVPRTTQILARLIVD
jgi:hypothetical protein